MTNLPEKFLSRMRVQLGGDYDKYISSYGSHAQKGLHLRRGAPAADIPVTPIYALDNCYHTDQLNLGKHIYHAAGLYYMQEPSAMLPALSCDIPKDARILDMCAAPGGKTSQLALRASSGLVVANEYDRARAAVLRENVVRMGYDNVAVVNMFPDHIAHSLPGYFDVVMVDAPCSGEGMFRKNPAAADEWSVEHVLACARRQKEIVKSAAACLRTGGTLIYSTCTFAPEEDEEVAEYITSLGFAPVPVNPDIAALGKAAGSGVKFYPHIFGEGQFVAVFSKTAASVRPNLKIKAVQPGALALRRLSEIMDISGLTVRAQGDILYSALAELPPPFDFAARLGQVERDGRITPAHSLFRAYGARVHNSVEVSEADAQKYLRGEELSLSANNGWGCIKYAGYPLGGYKASAGKLKNHYPKALRLTTAICPLRK